MYACRAAGAFHALRRLGLGSGLLLAVPIPQEDAAEGQAVESAIETALAEAAQHGIGGNQVCARLRACVCDSVTRTAIDKTPSLFIIIFIIIFILLSLLHCHKLNAHVNHACLRACIIASHARVQVTPFLLERVRSLTGGKSLAANIKLVKSNARVGSQMAVELAAMTAASAAPKSKL